MVVGDGRAADVQCLRDGGLDLVPLLDGPAPAACGVDAEVGRGPVRVDMGEPAGQHAGHPGGSERGRGRFPHCRAQGLEAIPGARGFEGLHDHRLGRERVALVRHAEERRAPRVGRARGRRVSRRVGGAAPVRDGAAVLAADLGRPAHRFVHGVVRGLESEDQHSTGRLDARVDERLHRIEQPAVRRIQRGLGDGAGRGHSRAVVVEHHRGSGSPARTMLHAHPRLGDDPEDALRSEEHPVRRGSRARRGKPARFTDPARGHHPHRFDHVVDVGIDGRVVAARPGGQPAAERRELERLREVPEGQALRP